MVGRKFVIKSSTIKIILPLLIMVCISLYAQQFLSSPVTLSRNGSKAGEVRWQNADGTYFGFKGSTKGTNLTVSLPNTAPTAGTCIGYISALATDWVACSGSSSYDPTLGILMVDDTNPGVLGTGDGGHYYWSPISHTVNIQSWYGGAIAPILVNASYVQAPNFHGDILLTTVPALCASGSYARGVSNTVAATGCTAVTDASNGIYMVNSTTTGATGTGDGGHVYWSTSNHWLEIQSWFSGSVAPIRMISASHVDVTSLHGDVLLTTTPTLCASGSYARGVDTSINASGCTIAIATDASNGIFMINNTTLNATSTGDGGHFYWSPGGHFLSLQSWYNPGTGAALAPIVVSASSVSFSNTITVGISPTLCSAGNYARGIDTGLNATGCTLSAAGADPTIGFRINNNTGTNATGTTTGLHMFYDTSVNEGHIESYQSGFNQVLVLSGSTLYFNGLNSIGGNVSPGLDNNYSNGISSNRWNDMRSVTAHFGNTPLDIPSGTVTQNVCSGSPCLVVVDSTASGGIAAFITRSGGSGALANGSTVGVYGARGYDGSWVSSTSGSMVMTTTEAWNGTHHGMNITFNTTAIGSTSAATRLIIDSNGLTVNSMTGGSSRAVCVTSAGLIYAAAGTTCP